jgi:hypothetical protein
MKNPILLLSLLLFSVLLFSQSQPICQHVYNLDQTNFVPVAGSTPGSMQLGINQIIFYGNNSLNNASNNIALQPNNFTGTTAVQKYGGIVTQSNNTYFINGLVPNIRYQINVNRSEGYSSTWYAWYAMWIDFNGNGYFEDTEKLTQGNPSSTVPDRYCANFVAPANIVPYPAIRIFRSNSSMSGINSCGPTTPSNIQAFDFLNGNTALATNQHEIKSFSIFPNPAKDHITIDCGTLVNVEGYSIKITNTLGQELFNQPLNTPQYTIPLNSWGGQGMYFVNVIDAQGHTIDIKKIILQ